MRRRAIYTIPLLGLSLTTGCDNGGEELPTEALVGTFRVDYFDGLPTPYTLSAIDVLGDGSVICDQNYTNTDVTFSNLSGSTTYEISYTDCVDDQGNPSEPALIPQPLQVTFAIEVSAVVLNTTYDVTLTPDNGDPSTAFVGCSFAADTLDCGDGNFVLVKQ